LNASRLRYEFWGIERTPSLASSLVRWRTAAIWVGGCLRGPRQRACTLAERSDLAAMRL